ncbi:GNAT family N-acetyltransferase [Galbibacter sp.]|uniref:GNAT family N-acetyltransferase n=1 Tax=Galbibacter sp. TaxID=2918471 RepID=UPI002C62535E|nr:GNAT family N-acetyltransferase [Galbibacter sp.]HLV63850.1 GNAT family N-acetyltransferase [Galbibacter sp.]
MKYTIRIATKSDMSQVLELIQELAEFEKEADAVVITKEDLERDGFSEHPLFKCFVAEKKGQIDGIALCYPRYSTWKGRTLHLEDLVVRQNKRGLGLGSALFKEVIKYGAEQGVRRIEWVVLNWNETAVEFYKKNGAQVLSDWDTVQMDENGIKKFIDKNS